MARGGGFLSRGIGLGGSAGASQVKVVFRVVDFSVGKETRMIGRAEKPALAVGGSNSWYTLDREGAEAHYCKLPKMKLNSNY